MRQEWMLTFTSVIHARYKRQVAGIPTEQETGNNERTGVRENHCNAYCL